MDASIVSALVNLLGFMVGGIAMAVTVRNNVIALQKDVAKLTTDIGKLNEVVTQLAVQSERIDMLDRRYEELRHGEGFTFPLANSLRDR